MAGGRRPLLRLQVARVSPAFPWFPSIQSILQLQGIIQLSEHLIAFKPTDLKSEILFIQSFLLLLWRGAGVGRQCSLSAPRGWLGARLPLLAKIFFLSAAVSPRTGTNSHLKAVPSQQVTTRVFQCDDGEDGPPVHAPHTGAVTHEVVMDGGALRVDLGGLIGHHHTVSKGVPVVQILCA